MFSQTSEYALRAIVWMASQATDFSSDGSDSETVAVDASSIAAATQVPPSYLAKILQQLVRAGLLQSRRGARGGFRLARDPSATTVLDVVNAVDPICRITECPLGLATHQDQRCPMHARLDESLAQVEQTLGESTIADLLTDPSRPTPLRDTIGC